MRLQASPWAGNAPAPRKLRPTGDRALFELRAAEGELPRGWIRLRLEIDGNLTAPPRLLLDDGDDTALPLPMPRGGRIQSVVELPPNTARVLLELEHDAPVRLGSLLVEKLGRIQSAVGLAMPIVRKRLAEPWTIPIAALKVARGLWTGDFLRTLVHKQVPEDLQVWYPVWHRKFAALTDGDRSRIRAAVARMQDPPKFSIVTGAGTAAAQSLQKQLYPHWELCSPDGAARGDYVMTLAGEDELEEHALYLLALAHPAGVIYADEDSADTRGRLHDPLFKPGWNPDFFYSSNYLSRCVAVRAGQKTDYASLLELCAKGPVRHVPFPLLHRRAADAPDGSSAILQQHLAGQAEVEPGPFPSTNRVRWKVPSPPPLVSLMIPTRDRRSLLEPCVESLLAVTGYRNFEILVVDNGSREPDALEYLKSLETRGVAKVLRYDQPFNFSAINNFAAAQARGELLGLLNNDLEFIEPGWLEEMVSHAVRPEIGAVGARLLYPDRTVQHAGVILGIGGLADHVHKDLPAEAPGYCGRARLTQNFSAVTAACLLVRRETYLDAGGFDETFEVAFNDVDFCLRLLQRGLRNVWTPFATVIHHESKSRGREDTLAKIWRFRSEKRRLAARWRELLRNDPAYNPNLTVEARNAGLAWPPRVRKPWR